MTKYAKYTQTEAAVRAKAKVGKSTLKGKVGQCLAEQVNPANSSPYSIPAPWGFAGNGEDWAVNYWLNAVAKGKVVKTSDHAAVPKGALTFAIQKSEVGKAKPAKAGHVWTSDGASGMYTTDRPTNGKWGHVSTKSVLDAWGMVQLGYVIVTGDGYTLTDPPKTPATRVTAVWGKPDTWRIGSIGPDVTKLGQRLEVWAAHYGLSKPYTVGPSPEFTEVDRRAVEVFQKKRGWTGTGADGYPGAETFKILATDPPPTEPEPPVSKTVTLHGLHWNIAGSDVHNGYGARNATRGPDVGSRALEIGFDVFLACEAGQTNLRAGVNTVLGQHKPWYSHAKAIWASDDIKLLVARKAYADNLYNYLKTVKYGAGIFAEIEGKKFGILEIHTDYRKPAKQAAQVKSLFAKFRKDCDALGIKHVNQFVVGDLNWDGTSGDDPFKALASYNFVEKGSHTAKTFFTGKHLDGVLAHEEAEVTVKVRDRVNLSDHYPLEFTAHLK